MYTCSTRVLLAAPTNARISLSNKLHKFHSISTGTRLWGEQLKWQCSIPGRGKHLFFPPQHPDQFWVLPSLCPTVFFPTRGISEVVRLTTCLYLVLSLGVPRAIPPSTPHLSSWYDRQLHTLPLLLIQNTWVLCACSFQFSRPYKQHFFQLQVMDVIKCLAFFTLLSMKWKIWGSYLPLYAKNNTFHLFSKTLH